VRVYRDVAPSGAGTWEIWEAWELWIHEGAAHDGAVTGRRITHYQSMFCGLTKRHSGLSLFMVDKDRQDNLAAYE